jgi:hypothetical protein
MFRETDKMEVDSGTEVPDPLPPAVLKELTFLK